jgi:hypothetical protein
MFIADAFSQPTNQLPNVVIALARWVLWTFGGFVKILYAPLPLEASRLVRGFLWQRHHPASLAALWFA